MPVRDEALGEIRLKIVFAGTQGAGKASALGSLHRLLGEGCSPMTLARTACDQTISFDYRPAQPLIVSGLRARFRFLTVPGRVHYRGIWQLALQGVDGLVFVADSTRARAGDSLAEMRLTFDALGRNGMSPGAVPTVIACNKRDLADTFSPGEMGQAFAALAPRAPLSETCALTGEGLLQALQQLSIAMGIVGRPAPKAATAAVDGALAQSVR